MQIATTGFQQLKTVLILWLLYILLALTTLYIWTKNDRYPVEGDEPHYLLIADSIFSDQTFEVTKSYKREFMERKIQSDILVTADAISGTEKIPHLYRGPNGLFSKHNIGLPILIAIPYGLADVVGVKIFLVLISSLIVPLVWGLSGMFSTNFLFRALATSATVYCAPLIPAANQIFPDLLAGLIGLFAGYRIFRIGSDHADRGNTSILVAAAIALLPWLQLKFSAAALILMAGLCLASYTNNRSKFRVFLCLAVFAGSLFLLASYNQYAFGRVTGPYGKGALQFNTHALMVFLGLHIDRFQGYLIQNPAFFFGVAFLIPLLKKHKIAASFMLLTYASVVVPNALHPNWYGGYSFAGRFAWTGVVTIAPFFVYGLINVMTDFRRGYVLVAVLVGLNLITYINFTFNNFDLYNIANKRDVAESILLSSYPSFQPWASKYLPALYDSSRAFVYTPNAAFVIFVIGLLILSGGYKKDSKGKYYKSAGIFSVCCIVLALTAGLTGKI